MATCSAIEHRWSPLFDYFQIENTRNLFGFAFEYLMKGEFNERWLCEAVDLLLKAGFRIIRASALGRIGLDNSVESALPFFFVSTCDRRYFLSTLFR